MYWVVLGIIAAAEMTVEWVVNWIPFYYEIKTVLIIWLTLPQIQGSTFIYLTYIHPFLASHEAQIDASLADAKEKAKMAGVDYLRRGIKALKEFIISSVAPGMAEIESSSSSSQNAQTSNNLLQQPAYADPTHPESSFSAYPPTPQALTGLLYRYGPAVLTAGNALFNPMNTRVGATAAAARPNISKSRTLSQLQEIQRQTLAARSTGTDPRGGYEVPDVSSTRNRRRSDLQRELEALDAEDNSSPTPGSSRKSWLGAASAPQGYSTSPRAASEGGSVAESFVGGFSYEKVSRDEATPRRSSPTGQPLPPTSPGGSWWWSSGAPSDPSAPSNKQKID